MDYVLKNITLMHKAFFKVILSKIFFFKMISRNNWFMFLGETLHL